MSKYRLVEWEENGYHDSDFYIAFWDDEEKKVGSLMFGTTRFGGPNTIPEEYLLPTLEVVLEARKALVTEIYDMLRSAEELDLNEPRNVQKGETLELIKKTRHKGIIYHEGTRGTVIWVGAFGTFYRNGYNKPGRHNLCIILHKTAHRRVGLKLPDGRVFFTALSNCKRGKEPTPDADLRKTAENYSWNLNFKVMVSKHGGWLSANFARAALVGTEYEKTAKREEIIKQLLLGVDKG